MRILLQNGKAASIRKPGIADSNQLLQYLQSLSGESRSRFGPHPFDLATVERICENPDKEMQYFIAIDESSNLIVAYMLIKQGMIDADRERYAQRNQFYDYNNTVTYAPSVADDWQSSGLGSAMFDWIKNNLGQTGIRYIILWGGVQATNLKAVNFYKKNGYEFVGSFWHDNKDNYDMIKELVQ